MKKFNNRGFASTESLLVIVILALVGFIGWYVYHSKNNTNKTLETVGQTSNSVGQASSANSAKIAKIAILGYGFQAANNGGIDVPVTIKNNDKVAHKVTIKVTFSNVDGQTLETDTAMVENLAAGETKTATVSGTNKVATFSNIKPEVQSVD